MKLSIKFLTVIALIFTFTFAANAQRGGGKSIDPETRAEKETTRMVEKLTLDETQAVQVKALNLTYAERIEEAREAYKSDRAAMKEIEAAINSEKNTEMKLILTETQFKAYEAMQVKKGKGQRKRGKGGRRSK